MSSLEKFKLLMEYQCKNINVKIITVRDEEFFCRLHDPAEDEEDWAYHFITLDNPPRYFILECNYIKSIEALETSAAIPA